MVMHVDRAVLTSTRRKTYWKLNTAILDDQDFLPRFTSLWESILKYRQHFLDIAE
jgi:hypothetical protein